MIIVGALTAFIIGPIGVWVGNGLGVGLAWMNTHAPFIFAIIIPMLYRSSCRSVCTGRSTP